MLRSEGSGEIPCRKPLLVSSYEYVPSGGPWQAPDLIVGGRSCRHAGMCILAAVGFQTFVQVGARVPRVTRAMVLPHTALYMNP